jgi:hypothetical protein
MTAGLTPQKVDPRLILFVNKNKVRPLSRWVCWLLSCGGSALQQIHANQQHGDATLLATGETQCEKQPP